MRSDFIREHQLDAMRIAGKKVGAGRGHGIDVVNPFTSKSIGSVPKATLEEVRSAFALKPKKYTSSKANAGNCSSTPRVLRLKIAQTSKQIVSKANGCCGM